MVTIPLDPGAGGKSIGSDVLQIGDIIVSTTSQFVSKAIKFGTMSQVSHSALYIGGEQTVEAIGEGVVMQSLDVSLQHDTLAVVYRYPGLSAASSLQIRDYVGNQLGKPYAYAGAAQSGIDKITGNRKPLGRNFTNGWACAKVGVCYTENSNPFTYDKFFCSHLVAAAFASVDAPIVNMLSVQVTPADIADVAVNLLYVGHLKAPAEPARFTAIHENR